MYIIYYIYRETQSLEEEIWVSQEEEEEDRQRETHSSVIALRFVFYTVGRATCWANKNPNQKSYFLNARQNEKKKQKKKKM